MIGKRGSVCFNRLLVRPVSSFDDLCADARRCAAPVAGPAPRNRNPYGLPIGDLLFEKRHHTSDVRQAVAQAVLQEEESLRLQRCAHPCAYDFVGGLCHRHLFFRYSSSTTDRIVQQLRSSAWGRVFRRLLRSVAFSDAQKTAIWSRQVAVGMRTPAKAFGSSATPDASLAPASMLTPPKPSSHRHSRLLMTPPFSADASSVPSAAHTPNLCGPFSFTEALHAAAGYESDESGDEHRPEPSGELTVSVCVYFVLAAAAKTRPFALG
jgi:hypothetical protein